MSVKLTETGTEALSAKWPLSHEEWIIELFGGLSQEDKQMMLATLRQAEDPFEHSRRARIETKLGLIGRRR